MLEIHPLGQQEFRIALPTYHMFKDKKQLKLINLANENLILFKENCLSRKIVLDMFHRSEIATTPFFFNFRPNN